MFEWQIERSHTRKYGWSWRTTSFAASARCSGKPFERTPPTQSVRIVLSEVLRIKASHYTDSNLPNITNYMALQNANNYKMHIITNYINDKIVSI